MTKSITKKHFNFLKLLSISFLMLLATEELAGQDLFHFTRTADAAISGYNNKRLTNVTPEECASACSDETSFECKSFDFYKNRNMCDLSSKSASEVGGLKSDYSGNPYDHYARIKNNDPRIILIKSKRWKNSAYVDASWHGGARITECMDSDLLLSKTCWNKLYVHQISPNVICLESVHYPGSYLDMGHDYVCRFTRQDEIPKEKEWALFSVHGSDFSDVGIRSERWEKKTWLDANWNGGLGGVSGSSDTRPAENWGKFEIVVVDKLHALKIGDEHLGGIIFEIDACGKGKVFSKADIGKSNWDEAISACKAYTGGGQTGWYLPTMNELELMKKNLKLSTHNAYGFQNGAYWSSTVNNQKNNKPWTVYIPNIPSSLLDKERNAFVRAVREF